VTGLEIEISDLMVTFGEQVVLDGLNLTVAAGESVAVMGPSGSGKTSLLNCVMGTHSPQEGDVRIGAWSMSGLSPSERTALRRGQMGLVFQNADLLPELSVGENVAITRIFDGQPRKRALEAAELCLAEVGLASLRDQEVHKLSGGEAQRVALARSLCREEIGLMIADEPTASLDRANADMIADLLLERARSRGATVLLATHDPAVAERCDRTVQLQLVARQPTK